MSDPTGFNDAPFSDATFDSGLTVTEPTIVSPVDRITDHAARALDRLAEQFR